MCTMGMTSVKAGFAVRVVIGFRRLRKTKIELEF